MYKVIRTISYAIRYWLCYVTIENIRIFDNEVANWTWGEAGIFTALLLAIAYPLTAIWYDPVRDDKLKGSIIYFLIYIPLLFVLWIVLNILTWTDVLPIGL